jgi:hypothetical protein
MKRIIGCLALTAIASFVFVQNVHAQSEAMQAAQDATTQQVDVPAAANPQPASSGTPAASPPPVEPTILKQLRDHTPIPIRSSLDQAADTNGDRVLSYEEIKEYIKTVRTSISKNGKYPTNTDILYHFDKDHDGEMDAGEISALESYIR